MTKTPPYVGLLDTYTGATAAYSLRKLTRAYTGYAIRVRRSTDDAVLDVGFNTNGTLDTASILSFIGYNNQALYSEEFDNIYWTKSVTTVTSNQTTAPDGTMTADLLSEAGTTNNHSLISPNGNIAIGNSWNISVYVKKGPGTSAPDTFMLGFSGSGAILTPSVLFNISSGTVIDSSNPTSDTNFGSSIVDAGNGWWRCSVWGTATVGRNCPSVGVIRFNNNLSTISGTTYAGNTQANMYVWGYQFSKAFKDTSILTTKPYVKTTASATSTNGFVTTWYDQSGNGNDLAQTTSANQARICFGGIIDTLNDKPALASITNSAPSSRYTVAFTTTPITAFSVFHTGSNAGVASGFLWDGVNVTDRVYARSFNTTSIQIGRASAFTLNSYTQNINTQRIINGIYNNLSSKVSINNGVYTTGSTGALQGISGITLGADYNLTQMATAYYQEHIVYPSDQSSNVINIDTNINSFYSIY
jgi:hypothetical protein